MFMIPCGVAAIASGTSDPAHREYQVTKKWTLNPEGQINLNVSVEFLNDLTIAEPAYNFSFNQAYGWSKASVLRHNSDTSICCGADGDGTLNEHNSEITYHIAEPYMSDTNSCLKHAQTFKLHGRAGGASIKLAINENGGGYEKSASDGILDFGENTWQSLAESTSEMTLAAADLGHGVTMHWYGWWGGGNPAPERYKHVPKGTKFSRLLRTRHHRYLFTAGFRRSIHAG